MSACDHDRTFTRIDRLGPMLDVSVVLGRGEAPDLDAEAVVLEKTIICSDCRAELEHLTYDTPKEL